MRLGADECRNNWATLDPVASSTSPELVACLTTLQTQLHFIKRALAPAVFGRCFRAVAHSLQNYLWDHVVKCNKIGRASCRERV